MSKRPSIGQSLALKAAAAARSYDDCSMPRDETDTIPAASDDPEEMNAEQLAILAADRAAHDRHAARVAEAQHEERWSEEPPVPDEDLAGDHGLGPGRAPGQFPAPAARRGRPKGRREVEARQTVYLDKDRHEALTKAAARRGCSVHSLILQGIDMITDRPIKPVW